MANFFTDNQDIQFLFNHMDMGLVAQIMEDGFKYHQDYDFAPEDTEDAVDNYQRILDTIGELSGTVIAPTAEETDIVGNVLNDDGSVTYAPGISNALEQLSKADLMGFTLPYQYGGINCPQLVYCMSNEMVSRADASLMNMYGLQGIAETVNAFGDEQLKADYLPPMASGEYSGAMVLTEPDAGSDLQAVKVRAYQDDNGNWYITGVKRFITNGCGDVLLVLARTEENTTDGRGLSLLLVPKSPQVKVRRLEHKLGINGSPTCELFFDDAPARLIGERQRGLITYVMSLMNGARIGIASQSLGIGEAAYRVARNYAHSRKQFGIAIETLPAVRELLVDMNIDLQAARVLTYVTAMNVDIEFGALKKLGSDDLTAEDKKAYKRKSRTQKRLNGMLTPMSKYYASEMSMRVANDSVAVLGGSGYMKDYASERHLRDSRITTIYEGTSQLQVVAAVRGICSGTADTLLNELLDRSWPSEVQPYVDQLRDGQKLLAESITFVKQEGNEYMDLYGRKIVDAALALIIGAMFCDHATVWDVKLKVLNRWMKIKMPLVKANHEMITSGDKGVITDFDLMAGPVPVLD